MCVHFVHFEKFHKKATNPRQHWNEANLKSMRMEFFFLKCAIFFPNSLMRIPSSVHTLQTRANTGWKLMAKERLYRKTRKETKKVFTPKCAVCANEPAPTLEGGLHQSYAKMSPLTTQTRTNTGRRLMAVKEDGIFCFTNMCLLGIINLRQQSGRFILPFG